VGLEYFITTPNPGPTLTSLSQIFAIAGSNAFTLTVNGANFIDNSVVQWNGVGLATTFVSATQLTVLIPQSDLATAGTISISVVNPEPGGGASIPLTFMIDNPVPVLTSLSQTSAVSGGPSFTLTVAGGNFVTTSVLKWNGAALVTTYISPTQLMATVPSSNLTNPGNANVTAFTPAPGGGISTGILFTITIPVPVLTAIAPNSSTAGSPAFTLTLTGTSFITSSVARWNGAALPTTFVSATQLTALIPAIDVQAPGTASVAVFSSQRLDVIIRARARPEGPIAPGQLSNSLTFTITETNPVPALVSSSSISATAGSPALTLILTGSNFVSGTVVRWNGAALITTIVSGAQLSATVPASDIAATGTASITVFNPLPGGGVSNALAFTINDPVPALTSASQTSAVVGSGSFTLTLTGSNFVNGTIVKWNGVALVTTFVSSTQLTATIPVSDMEVAGIASITIFNPTPGGGASTALTFSIVDFSVSSTTSPQTVKAGQSAMFKIATAPVDGPFTGPVTFTVAGLPAGSVATFSPMSVTPGTSSIMTVTTTARTTSVAMRLPIGPDRPKFPTLFAAWITLMGLAALYGRLLRVKVGRNRPRLVPAGAMVLLMVTIGYLAGCAQGFPKTTTTSGTLAGTYILTVTGTSGTDGHATTVTLVVQ
jgi:hypothetical protein